MTRSITIADGEFDYVIVGGGAAGCLLASRLASHRGTTVCVVEAGPRDTHPYFHVPAGFIKMIFDERYTWHFSSEPCEGTAGRPIKEIQARVLGGGSSINGMIFVRGQPDDFDGWARAGNLGWSYADVLPYFKRLERRIEPRDDSLRGSSGQLPVTDVAWQDPLSAAFIKGAVASGLAYGPDYNGLLQQGVSYNQTNIAGGWRRGAARVFLRADKQNRRLRILTGAMAQSIVFEGQRAIGVRYTRTNASSSASWMVSARREVIVCSGAINTPKLLQLSGIGSSQVLQRIGVPVIRDLPVGQNLQNHYIVQIVAKAKNCLTINEYSRGIRFLGQVGRWLAGYPSILALPAATVSVFAKSDPSLPDADFQGVFAPASFKQGTFGVLDEISGMTLGVRQHRPESRGTVCARSNNYLDPPIIQPNYLGSEIDRHVLVAAIRQGRSLLRTEAMRPYVLNEDRPGYAVRTDDEILDYARQTGASAYHLTGTAQMGPVQSKHAVVDNNLRVHGIAGLRVVDASIMPSIPSANTQATTLMIAEKAADMILGLNPVPAHVH